MLQDSGRSRVIACHSREIENILLDYYHLENIKMVERKMVTGQGYGLGIGGCTKWCRRGHGAWLGYTAFPVWSVKDRSLHKILGKSQTYYPEHILIYGRLEDLLLSCHGFGSFRTGCQGFFLVEEVLAPR